MSPIDRERLAEYLEFHEREYELRDVDAVVVVCPVCGTTYDAAAWRECPECGAGGEE